MAPPTPVIQASSSSVGQGENLQVVCTVLGEQDVLIDFSWEYPGQQVRKKVTPGGKRRRGTMVVILDILRYPSIDQRTSLQL